MNLSKQILEYVTAELAPSANGLTQDTNLVGEGVLDSTAMLQLVLWVEDSFDFPVEDVEMTPENFGTVRNIVDYIHSKTKSQPQA